MGTLLVEPGSAEALARLGLTGHADFLGLSGVIYSGHPGRNVAAVELRRPGAGAACFLKREYRVGWRERWKNLTGGAGWVSASLREFRALGELRAAGVPCPRTLAAGEDGRGRAFLLVEAVPGAAELRDYLRGPGRDGERRRGLIGVLAAALAKVHAAGFEHRDLYSKHVLVRPEGAGRSSVTLLDWQRARRRPSWRGCCRDLAALHATLADDLATPADRLRLLRAYWRARGLTPARAERRLWVSEILRRAQRLLRRRRIQALRQPPIGPGEQNLIWLDGEALCVTRQFHQESGGRVPEWLRRACTSAVKRGVHRQQIDLPLGGRGRFVRRRGRDVLGWLWSLVRRRPAASPQLRQAKTLYLLQRYHVVTPRLLAVGQRDLSPWERDSFLLTETPRGAVTLCQWLKDGKKGSRRPEARRDLLRQGAELLRRLHASGHVLKSPGGLWVNAPPGGGPGLFLGDIEAVTPRRRLGEAARAADLRRLRAAFARWCTRAEMLRFVALYRRRRGGDARDRVGPAAVVLGGRRGAAPALRLGGTA